MSATAMASYPHRHQYFPNNANSGAVSYKCANLNTLYSGATAHPQISDYGKAIQRCSGGPGGNVYLYIFKSGHVVASNFATTGSEAVRISQYTYSGGGVATCSLLAHSGPNYYKHYLECVSRF